MLTQDQGKEKAHKLFSGGLSRLERVDYLKSLEFQNGDLEAVLSYNETLGEPISDGEGCHLTDLGNCKRLVAQYGDRIRHCYERKKWLLWTGKRWELDDGLDILEFAKQTALGIYGEASKETDDNHRAELVKHAKASESGMRLKAMVELAQSERGIPVRIGQFDSDDWLLNCKNGTIDLRTGNLKPHDPGDLITRMVPLDYDPDAKSELWDNFLIRIFNGDLELIAYIQKCVGCSITGAIEMLFWFCHGMGFNGKSTFFNAIVRTLGDDYAREVPASAFMVNDRQSDINETIAGLLKIRLVVATELTDGQILDVAFIKRATGGESLKSNRKWEHEFYFRPSYKLFLCGNHQPRIKDTTNSIWGRLCKVPFEVTIPENERIANFSDKLVKECKQTILAWLVKGCLKYQNEGLERPDIVIRATSDYRENQDALAEYLSERCFVESTATITVSELYKNFHEWHEGNGTTPLGKASFNERMREKDFKTVRGTGNKLIWQGIRLREALDPDDQGKVTNFEAKVTSVTKNPLSFSTREIQEKRYAKQVTEVTPEANGEAKMKSNFPVTLVTFQNEKVTTPDGVIKVGDPEVDDMPDYPHEPCFACKGTDFWADYKSKVWVCEKCHPQPKQGVQNGERNSSS